VPVGVDTPVHGQIRRAALVRDARVGRRRSRGRAAAIVACPEVARALALRDIHRAVVVAVRDPRCDGGRAAAATERRAPGYRCDGAQLATATAPESVCEEPRDPRQCRQHGSAEQPCVETTAFGGGARLLARACLRVRTATEAVRLRRRVPAGRMTGAVAEPRVPLPVTRLLPAVAPIPGLSAQHRVRGAGRGVGQRWVWSSEGTLPMVGPGAQLLSSRRRPPWSLHPTRPATRARP
jgi:hypothetical protein